MLILEFLEFSGLLNFFFMRVFLKVSTVKIPKMTQENTVNAGMPK